MTLLFSNDGWKCCGYLEAIGILLICESSCGQLRDNDAIKAMCDNVLENHLRNWRYRFGASSTVLFYGGNCMWSKVGFLELLGYSSFFIIIKFSLGNIHYTGGFIVTILIRLILYIICIAPIVSTLQPTPTPLKAITRGYLALFHVGIWRPSTIYHHLNLLLSSSPPHTHTHCACFTVLLFITNI
jgi:hypothetical protein